MRVARKGNLRVGGQGEIAELEYLDGELTPERKNSSSYTDITGDKFETTE